jgi:hypothetical protein
MPRKGPTSLDQVPGVIIRGRNGFSVSVASPADLKRKAMQWTYVVRNRIRWTTDTAALDKIRENAIRDLASLGLGEKELKQLEAARLVEVQIPFTREEEGWEFRILPWEFLLSAATGSPIVIVRHLQCREPSAFRPPRSVGIVASLPGRLKRSGYEFDSEIALVRSNLFESDPLWNPTLEQLRSFVSKNKPDVIHLAGVDLHEGHSILKVTESGDERIQDGYFVAASDGSERAVSSPDVADTVTLSGKWKPVLVTANVYNSGARTAPLLVASGAGAAIGFQDEIDNVAAEQFFTTFYKEWRASDWNLMQAFDIALQRVIPNSQKTGMGIVLWSGRPLVNVVPQRAKTARQRRPRERSVDLAKDLIATVDPVESVNYSLLHNERSLFKRFTLTNANGSKPITGLRLYVELCVGDQNYPFRTILDVAPGCIENLSDRIRIPLTSTLFRSLRESVRSVLFVKISCGNSDVREQTYPVRLLSIDEWLDTEQLNAYLPSFVLSRDPAVLRIVDAAQKHLMTLTDDPGAGFDGYQSVDPTAENPSEAIDLQVWALWSALSYDLSLSYINPPPSFEDSSQRLRSPSDVLDGKRGTCIDLALLLSACMEYIGLYPVIFLLDNHAFPGYWRSEQSRERFFEVGARADPRAEKKRVSVYPWVELKQGYQEVLELVRSGDLSPIESVWLTQNKGFWEARDAGIENLRNPSEFESMIDVQRARDEKVTPLPLVRKEG